MYGYEVPILFTNCPAPAGLSAAEAGVAKWTRRKKLKEMLKRALQELNAPKKQMAELEESSGLPTDKNLSLGQRLAWIKQRIAPRGRHLA